MKKNENQQSTVKGCQSNSPTVQQSNKKGPRYLVHISFPLTSFHLPVGGGTDMFGLVGHFGNATGVVGDGPVVVHRQHKTRAAQHAHGGHGRAEKTGVAAAADAAVEAQVVGHDDGEADHEDGDHRTFKTDRHSNDDVGAVATVEERRKKKRKEVHRGTKRKEGTQKERLAFFDNCLRTKPEKTFVTFHWLWRWISPVRKRSRCSTGCST